MHRTTEHSSFTPAPLKVAPLFVCLWVLLFVLYFPAARAGFVSDFTGWLDQVRNQSFSEYINRTNFKVVSLYQVTQLVTWLFYKLFGVNAWLWHLLFITLHVINACLLYILCAGMLRDAGAANYKAIGYTGCALFCVTPYISETIVWEPSFHYLQGLLLLLLILVWVQRYIHTSERRYILYSAVVYLLSTHTLEVFFITPWLVLTMALFYRQQLPAGKEIFSRLVLYFFVPLLILLLLRLVEFRLIYGDWMSRIGSQRLLSSEEVRIGKPAKYLFHLLIMGRYLPEEWHIAGASFLSIKEKVYALCDSVAGAVIFYTLMGTAFAWCIARYRLLQGRGRVVLLLSIWTLATLLLVCPMWFPDNLMVVFDRYSYFAAPFLFMIASAAIYGIKGRYMRVAIIAIFIAANLCFTVRANLYWSRTSHIVNNLVHNLPDPGNKTVVLLNVPEFMKGIPMIGSSKEGEYKLMHNLLAPGKKLTGKVYDAMSYNMLTAEDGAHVTVFNDSTLRVTLNQWGTWWWFEGRGAHSYENDDYKLDLVDPGHYYQLTLKKPAQQYLLLYQAGDKWKVTDMGRTGDQ